MKKLRIGVLFVCLALLATVAAPPAYAQDKDTAKSIKKKSRDLITREEILNSSKKDGDIYQLIRAVRPHFLAFPRGVRSHQYSPTAETQLYIDGNRSGGLEGLKLIMAMDVEEVRYLDPAKAEDQFGITHNGGAILVTLKRKP